MDGYLAKYQDPKQADAMTKIQSELDETKIILVRINSQNNLSLGYKSNTEFYRSRIFR